MQRPTNAQIALFLLIFGLLVVLGLLYKRQVSRGKVSEFGRYQGYSEAAFDGNSRTSDYLKLADGTRLAYDLILPTREGAAAGRPLPVLFKYTPYLRTITAFDGNGKNIIADLYDLKFEEKALLRVRYLLDRGRGRLLDPLFRTKWLDNMVRHGYAVIVVEQRGTGASFGVPDPSWEARAEEVDEILDWIAAQPWCDGSIGMFGNSFQAMTQLAAAATGNPHLKAIMPSSAAVDLYSALEFPGGIYNKAFGSFLAWSLGFLASGAVTPVDNDLGAALLAQARQEHGVTFGEGTAVMQQFPFRDDTTPDGQVFWKDLLGLYPFIERINRAGVPIYMTVGWYDLFTGDAFYWYRNLTVPRRLAVRPVDHSGMEERQPDLDYGVEAHRWFDYWLKGIDNGILDEAPIHYFVVGAAKSTAWQATHAWPPAESAPTRLYLRPGEAPDGGVLSAEGPAAPGAFQAYTVDYTTTSGPKSRWTAINWPRDYPDMRMNDAKSLAFTAPPLPAGTEVTGHPVAHLWLETDAPDLDVFVYLEEVDSSGRSNYITEGSLRASHRALNQAPFDNLGLPYHSHYQSDLVSLQAGEPIEMVFSLLPTSYRFQAGNRIRITIAFADADNFDTPVLDPAPLVRLLSNTRFSSFVDLPMISQP